MASYESDDSSDEDTASFITTNVLLGYASVEATEDEVSRLGGVATWLHSQPPPAHLSACLVCNERMPLLLQLHTDIPERFPGHERRLHVFGCRRKACRRKNGSVRAIRSSRVDPTVAPPSEKSNAGTLSANHESKTADGLDEKATSVTEPPKPSTLGSNIFGGARPPTVAGGVIGSKASNPFATSSAGSSSVSASVSASANPFSLGSTGSSASKPTQDSSSTTTAPSSTTDSTPSLSKTFAEKAKLSSPSSSSPSQKSSSSFPLTTGNPSKAEVKPREPGPQQPAYRQYYLDADYEALGEDPPAAGAANARILDVTEDTSSGGGGGGAATDSFEAESAHDRTFQRFADRLWHNPEQVLRYEFGGAPLLYSRDDEVGRALASASGGGGNTTGKISTSKSSSSSSGMPLCPNCGAQRTFECQITPHAIVELEAETEDDEDGEGGKGGDGVGGEGMLDGMEWGTIIVGVCERDCEKKGEEGGKGDVTYLEEWAGVQWEERRK